MNYRREIDGLRSIAVLPVILFHAGLSVFSGGYVGVDIFFVISGYLITTIIVAEIESGTFTIKNFYERRARRIMPALFFVIIVCIPLAWIWMPPKQLKGFSESIAAVSLFSSNILFWLQSGYFAPAAEIKPLLHTWSLAVEEQYYIFFPLFILATWRFGKKIIFVTLLLIGCVSLFLSQWGSTNYPSANFYLLPTRLWELLIGSLVAIYLISKETASSKGDGKVLHADQFFSCIGLALIGYSIFAFDEETPFPSFYALLPTIGAALIILFASKKTVVAKVLSSKIPVAIGLISYSAYLWHQPLFAFARLRSISEPSQALMLLLGFLSLPLAYITWKIIEKPFRDKSGYTRSQVFYSTALTAVILVGLGFVGYLNNGFSHRVIANGATFSAAGLDERLQYNLGLSKVCAQGFTLHLDCRTSNQPEILIWGDSFAMQLVSGVLASNKNAGIIQMTKATCGPLIGLAPTNKVHPEKWSNECLDFNESVVQWVQNNNSVSYAVLSSRFIQYFYQGWRIKTRGGVSNLDESVVYEYFSSTLEFLLSNGIQPIIFAPPPSISIDSDIGACLGKATIYGGDLNKCDFRLLHYKSENLGVISFLEKIDERYRVIWMEDYLCVSGVCRAAIGDAFIYRDSGHLSYEGGALIGEAMDFYSLITGSDKNKSLW